MKIIKNYILPLPGFVALAFYNIILLRKEYEYRLLDEEYYNKLVTHESIHEAQMRDFCKFIPIGGTIFYIIYILEFLFRLLFTKEFMNATKAYYHISFEREAFAHQYDREYLLKRKKFSQWK